MPHRTTSSRIAIQVRLTCVVTASLFVAVPRVAPASQFDGPEVWPTHVRAASARADITALRAFVASIPASMPPEFESDLLLRAADAAPSRPDNRAWLVATYERAFARADEARSSIKQAALPWTYSNTREAIVAAGHEFGLDANSLHARAVVGLLRVDPRRALERLQRIDFHVPALSCGDTLQFDVAEPYRALASVVRYFEHPPAGTADAEVSSRARGLLSARIDRLSSSVEIGPASAVLRAAHVPVEQEEELWARFADRVRGLRDDDRTFTASLPVNWTAMGGVFAALHAVRSPSLPLVLDSFRAYLVTHLATRRCSLVGADAQAVVAIELEVIDGMNDWLRRIRLMPIAASDIRGSHTIPSGRPYDLWRSERARHLLESVQNLVVTWNIAGTNPGVKAANQQALADVESDLTEWGPGEERSVSVYVHQRLALLSKLLALDTPLRPAVLDEIADLLRATAPHLPHVEWFAHLGLLLGWARESGQLEMVVRVLIASENPALREYARLEKLLDSPDAR